MDILEIVLLLAAAASALAAFLSIRSYKGAENGNGKEVLEKTAELSAQIKLLESKLDSLSRDLRDEHSRLRSELGGSVTASVSRLGDSLRDEQAKQLRVQTEQLKRIEDEFARTKAETLSILEKIRVENIASIDKMRRENTAAADKMRQENTAAMDKMRNENRESLDKINGTVNEKLQKTLDDKISKSFEMVNKRLAEVYEGLGEMKNVASGVSDLKNVLSNVKTRGIMGEIQLGAILSEILAPEQYGEQVELVPGSRRVVDFAVKLPGADDGSQTVYLPIDSKFPGDSYSNLLDAYDSGDANEIKAKRGVLISEIKTCAKSIRDKYVSPPYTTDFAIMFLPFEGLYAEVVNLGLVEQLQNSYKINIAGPSTMAAMLNSLQMGFRTLAIQKKSGEVWKILEAAKKEFSTFESVLDKTRDRLRQADEELDKLIGVRTRAINRKLKDVTASSELSLEDSEM